MRRNKSLVTAYSGWCISFLSLIFTNVYSQEVLNPPPAKYITTIPFTMLTGGIIIVHAAFDNYKDSLNFVLDTGSGGISLDSTTAAEFGVKEEMSDKTVTGIAGIKTVKFTYDHSIHFRDLDVEHLDFHINDYDILTSAYGIRIDGIIGYSFFRRYIVYINYETFSFDVYSPGSFRYPRGGYLMRPQFTTLPMQPVGIKDNTWVNTKYYFDTGAGLCMLLNDDLVQDSSLLRSKRKVFLTEAEGLGGKKSMSLTVIKEVRLGPYHFRNVPIYIFDDQYNITRYPILGGLIGNDILRRFDVILNYPEQQIYLRPNAHFLDSFDYSYTGLGMYIVNGAITVTEIMKKSPAEEAGFKEGDIIIGVENNLSGNIQAYKTLMQNSGTKVKVLINRAGDLQVLTIKVRSIL
jgi:hypothetical protein